MPAIYFLYIFSGAALLCLSFAPWNNWPLGFIALVPVFLFLREARRRALSYGLVFFYALLYGASISFISYHWLIPTLVRHGGINYIQALGVFLLYVLLSNTRIYIFFLLVHFLNRNLRRFPRVLRLRFISLPLLWCFAELIGPQFFPWYGGNIVGGDFYFIQAADLLGVRGLSLFWCLGNLALFELGYLFYIRGGKIRLADLKGPGRFALLGLLLLLIIHGYGFFRIKTMETAGGASALKRIAVIQGDTPLFFRKVRSQTALKKNIVQSMERQTLRLLRDQERLGIKPDLVIWPESSTPYLSYSSGAGEGGLLKTTIRGIQDAYPVQFYISDLKREGEKVFNNAVLLDKNGDSLGEYQKILLLPFGEYLPMEDTFPWLRNMFQETSSFSPGSRRLLLPSAAGQFLPLICYEAISSEFALESRLLGGKKTNLLLVTSNDRWFKRSMAARQHLELSRIRAIELRIPMIRATNSGISASIDALGRVTGASKLLTRQNLLYDVRVPDKPWSLFILLGYWPLNVLLGVYMFLCLGAFLYSRMGGKGH